MSLMSDDLRKRHEELKKVKKPFSKVKEFFYTVKDGRIDDKEYERRLEICQVCPYSKKENDRLYCNECGCPKWKMSALDDPHIPKLKWANLICPKGRFGAMNGVLNVLNKDEIKNLVVTAKKLINSNLVPTKERPASPAPSGPIDWNAATVSFPTDGFLTPADLQVVNQKMTEAIALEKFDEGVKFAFLVFALLRP